MVVNNYTRQGIPSFAPRRNGQGVPDQIVPLSRQTGQPQQSRGSTEAKLLSKTFGADLHKNDWSSELSGKESSDTDNWDEWNRPRWDVEKQYQAEHYIRQFIRECIDDLIEIDNLNEDELEEINSLGSGCIAGVITPLGTGPTYPNNKKRNTKNIKKKKI
jgi:hypothetical protein